MLTEVTSSTKQCKMEGGGGLEIWTEEAGSAVYHHMQLSPLRTLVLITLMKMAEGHIFVGHFATFHSGCHK